MPDHHFEEPSSRLMEMVVTGELAFISGGVTVAVSSAAGIVVAAYRRDRDKRRLEVLEKQLERTPSPSYAEVTELARILAGFDIDREQQRTPARPQKLYPTAPPRWIWRKSL